MSDGITLSGLWPLAGKTVSAWVAGLDCGDYVVSTDGTILVPFDSDPDGLMTAGWLSNTSNQGGYGDAECQIDVSSPNASPTSFTVYVPVVVGINFKSQGQILRPEAEAEVKTPEGSGLGKERRVHRVAALLDNAQNVSFGTVFGDSRWPLIGFPLVDPQGNAMTRATPFSGVYRTSVNDPTDFDGMVSWECDRPYPCTVVSVSGFLEDADQ